MDRIFRNLAVTVTIGVAVVAFLHAQGRGSLAPDAKTARLAVENELASLAIIDRKVMIPMRDGVRIAADIYRPKDTSKKYPVIWVRTPYNFNFWDVATVSRAT